jgi:hypothetical protein
MSFNEADESFPLEGHERVPVALGGPLSSPHHDHLRAHGHPTVEVDHVLVGQPKASRGDGLADGLRLV